MQYRILPVTPFQQNCSLIWCERTGLGALIDAGGEAERLLDLAEREGVRLEKLLLTHGHVDHAAAAGALSASLDIPIEGPHREDAFLLDALPRQSEMYGFPLAQAFRPRRWLEDGDTVRVGELSLEVLHCPGHTPGHVVFFARDARLAFVGDVLFRGSIGRTDFPRGDYGTLIHCIRHKLFPLGDEVRFVPGHGPMSDFGRERQDNPFVGDRAAGL
ncbi:MAG TPA: MBL fold metallo-hydrolase [Thiobacillaceae bacterium]|nr:MBL fold metallo-hydrolase [Thiobacillaceae bacterium]